jgi:hypothetical protein
LEPLSTDAGRGISSDGELTVPSISLDHLVFQTKELHPPNVVKIDVEGAEVRVLKGAVQTLTQFRPKLFIEIHGPREHTDCREFLEGIGYNLLEEHAFVTAVFNI